ncbi:MAG: hypothetical protein K2I43_04615 [Alistipes sp.]|nr:hypothetical protein [Alistipes sp.]
MKKSIMFLAAIAMFTMSAFAQAPEQPADDRQDPATEQSASQPAEEESTSPADDAPAAESATSDDAPAAEE